MTDQDKNIQEQTQGAAKPLHIWPGDSAQELAADFDANGKYTWVKAPRFEGKPFAGGGGAFRDPSTWLHLYNPFRPSWGEPYKQIVARMVAGAFGGAGWDTVAVMPGTTGAWPEGGFYGYDRVLDLLADRAGTDHRVLVLAFAP